MLRFQHGKSYLFLFPIYGALLMLAFFASIELTGNPTYSYLLMPGFLAYMLACEIRSGVALDSWWRAAFLKGAARYRETLRLHAFGTAVLLAFAAFAILSRLEGARP